MGYHRDLKRFAAREVYQIQDTLYEAVPCMYCGMPASDDEHVIPKTFTSRFQDIPGVVPFNLAVVPACRECNVLANKAVFTGIQDKRAYIHEKLKQHYRKALEIPLWTEEQLSELSLELAQFVRHGLKLREIILSRLRWRGSSGPVSGAVALSRRNGFPKSSVRENVGRPFIMRQSKNSCLALEVYQVVNGRPTFKRNCRGCKMEFISFWKQREFCQTKCRERFFKRRK